LAQNLIIDRTPEGMRIQLVDQDRIRCSQRQRKDAGLHKKLLDLVAQVVARMPNKISISGHTDSTPYQSDNGYSNWELSATAPMPAGASCWRRASPRTDRQCGGQGGYRPAAARRPSSPRNRRSASCCSMSSSRNPSK